MVGIIHDAHFFHLDYGIRTHECRELACSLGHHNSLVTIGNGKAKVKFVYPNKMSFAEFTDLEQRKLLLLILELFMAGCGFDHTRIFTYKPKIIKTYSNTQAIAYRVNMTHYKELVENNPLIRSCPYEYRAKKVILHGFLGCLRVVNSILKAHLDHDINTIRKLLRSYSLKKINEARRDPKKARELMIEFRDKLKTETVINSRPLSYLKNDLKEKMEFICNRLHNKPTSKIPHEFGLFYWENFYLEDRGT